ncbi:zinc ribbon domain-containing protein [Kineococcus sp. SYSU DK001]|uniref:zinc ribbon domain-containing protein n=1 Tax=Kineococcus sp. SYSU DK001 TaxID=3383122 RepID=UPI003D7D9C54
MPNYEYRCAQHGRFEHRLPLGTAPPVRCCPHCAADSPRVFSPPMVATPNRRALSLIEATERTAHEPAVVSAPPRPPGGGTARPGRDPALSRLPRP